MTTKALLFSICVLFLAACQPDLETIEVTARPSVTTTVLATHTAAPPTPTATDTAVPATSFPTATPQPTPTSIPIPSATPELVLPSASVLFMRDNTLQQWIPHTGEVITLVEDVTRFIIYSADLAVFRREITPEQEYALVVFHIPTQSESTIPLTDLYDSISISPNGRWLAYVSGNSRDSVTLMVHEIIVEDQQVTVSPPVLTAVPDAGWNWPYDQLTWPIENELSWSDQAGIWVADLNTDPIEHFVSITPSTNTFLLPPLNPADRDKESATVFTDFIPYLWSLDGRYLLVIEHFFEDGVFRVIERGTNRSIEVPESGVGPISDTAMWLNETTLLHYKANDSLQIWQINLAKDPPISLQKTIPLENLFEIRALLLMGNHLRFTPSLADNSLYDLNLETGELIQLGQYVSFRIPDWSPDGQYALWNDSVYANGEWFGHVFLDDLNGDAPVEMDSVFGLDSCCWHWYEE